jgi:uncharacterized protein
MELNEISYKDARPIDGYGPGFVRIGGDVFSGPHIITASSVLPWGGLEDANTALALSAEIDVLLVGTGEQMAYLPAEFRAAMEKADIGLEPMATASACRTFNVLLAEGRRVAAALLPV